MKRIAILLLLFLPVSALAVVCKSVNEHGVVTYTQLPGNECPEGVALPGYQERQQRPQVNVIETGLSVREVNQGAYQSVAITDPGPGGTVRSNEGRFTVKLELQPALQSSHFITVHIDGRNFQGRYGESDVTVKGIERGTHRIWATVSDSRGRELAKTAVTEFTLHTASQRLQVEGAKLRKPVRFFDDTEEASGSQLLGVSNVDTDSDAEEGADGERDRYGKGRRGGVVWGRLIGSHGDGAWVEVVVPGIERTFKGRVRDDGTWKVRIPRRVLNNALANDARVGVTAYTSGFSDTGRGRQYNREGLQFRQQQDLQNLLLKSGGAYGQQPAADYSTPGQGISSTPGKTNPAFAPNYSQ